MAARVINPEDLAAFAPAAPVIAESGPFAPRGMPSLEGSGVDMVIICLSEHAAIFQEIADLKKEIEDLKKEKD